MEINEDPVNPLKILRLGSIYRAAVLKERAINTVHSYPADLQDLASNKDQHHAAYGIQHKLVSNSGGWHQLELTSSVIQSHLVTSGPLF